MCNSAAGVLEGAGSLWAVQSGVEGGEGDAAGLDPATRTALLHVLLGRRRGLVAVPGPFNTNGNSQ